MNAKEINDLCNSIGRFQDFVDLLKNADKLNAKSAELKADLEQWQKENEIARTLDDAKAVLSQAEGQANRRLIEASKKEEAIEARALEIAEQQEKTKQDLSAKRTDIEKREEAIATRDKALASRENGIAAREEALKKSEAEMRVARDAARKAEEDYKEKLAAIQRAAAG